MLKQLIGRLLMTLAPAAGLPNPTAHLSQGSEVRYDE